MITNTQVKKIRKIQDRCVATIDKKLITSETYKHHKLLTFEDMITHETCKLWHKQHLKLLPIPLSRNMKTDVTGLDLSKSHGYNTRNKAYLNLPHAKNTSYSKSVLARGLKAYNELPIKIRASKNTDMFSASSKHYLLTKDTSN